MQNAPVKNLYSANNVNHLRYRTEFSSSKLDTHIVSTDIAMCRNRPSSHRIAPHDASISP
jgi:hypothetical protein